MSLKLTSDSHSNGLGCRSSAICFLMVWLLLVSKTVLAQVGVELGLHQQSFRVGEPVIVDVTITNNDANVVEITEPSLETQILELEIKKGNAEFKPLAPDVIAEPYTSPINLQPGELFRSQILIHFDGEANALALPESGMYTINASYLGVREDLMPGPVEATVEVIENLPEDTLFADFFSQREAAAFLTNSSRDAVVIQQLEDLIAQYPASLYARYGKFYLALYEARRFPDREPNLSRAIELMIEVDQAGFQLQADAIYHQGDWYWQLGDATNAFDALDRVINQFPGTAAAFRAAMLRQALQGETPPDPPPPAEMPLEGAIKDAVDTTLDAYFDAFEQQNSAAVLVQLDVDFLYNDTLGRDDMNAQLSEDFAKLVALGGTFSIVRDELRSVSVKGVPIIELRISYFVDGNLLSPPVQVKISFIETGGVWLIHTWNVM